MVSTEMEPMCCLPFSPETLMSIKMQYRPFLSFYPLPFLISGTIFKIPKSADSIPTRL